MPAIFKDGKKLVFDFGDELPTETRIDQHIARCKEQVGIEVAELVIHPQWTVVLMDALSDRGFERVGSVSADCITRLRWQMTLRQEQLTDEDQQIIRMRAGLNDLA
jgi:hypothetical protein